MSDAAPPKDKIPPPLSRRDFTRLAATSLAVVACPPAAGLMGEAAATLVVMDEEALLASAIFTMSL
ncbi:MAG TPA: hypothetical protein VKZ79_14735 [Alphaproteobacteria bacterium]|nr:hypothetical protein [Alphaproteobacteria bacterium]